MMKVSPGFKLFLALPLAALLLFIFSCTSGSSQPSEETAPLGPLSNRIFKTASNGTLRAHLEVYGPNGEFEYEEALSINQNTGQVFSSQFKVPRGFSYSFIVTFFYTIQGLPELPIAFVAKTEELLEDFFNFSWEASDIIYTSTQIAPDLSLSTSLDTLPDIDEDDDGFSNFYEILEGSSPLDPNDRPIPPTHTSGTIPNQQQDLIEFSLIFEDASGISEIKPENPICGYSLWEVTPLNPEGTRQQLHAIFNTHANSAQNAITLQISATDILGVGETFLFNVSFTQDHSHIDPNKRGPEIAILTPRSGETVSDTIVAEAIACDENQVNSLTPIHGNLGDQDSNPSRYFGNIDTSILGDGGQDLPFTASNNNGHSRIKSVPIIVVNNSPIKIDAPTPGSDVQDNFSLLAHVDKNIMPDVVELFIESVTSNTSSGNEDSDFASLKDGDENSLAEAFKKSLNSSFEPSERLFTVTYRAVGSKSTIVTREVSYRINNDPDINFFIGDNGNGVPSCIGGGKVTLKWKVTNRGSTDLILLNEENKTNSTGEGQFDVDCQSNSSNYTLEAERGNYTSSKTITLTKLLDIQGLTDGQIIPEPDYFKFSFIQEGNPVSQSYRVKVIRDGVTEKIIEDYNEEVVLKGLEPRSDYILEIEILNNNNQVISQASYNVTTSDQGMTGWWRFLENAGGSTADFSGNNNSMNLQGSPWESDPIMGTGVHLLDNGQSYLQTSSDNTHGLTYGLTIEALVKFNNSQHGHITTKDGEYSLEFSGSGYLNHLIFNMKATHCFGAWYGIVASANPLDLNKPYHVAVTFDGHRILFFVNGVLESTHTLNNSPTLVHDCSGPIVIGGIEYLSNEVIDIDNMDALIGEVAIYNRPLSEIEIRQNCHRLASDICHDVISPIEGSVIAPTRAFLQWKHDSIINNYDVVVTDSDMNPNNDPVLINCTNTGRNYCALDELAPNTNYDWSIYEAGTNNLLSGPHAFSTDDQRLGWWKFDEGTGNTTLDVSNLSATLVGAQWVEWLPNLGNYALALENPDNVHTQSIDPGVNLTGYSYEIVAQPASVGYRNNLLEGPPSAAFFFAEGALYTDFVYQTQPIERITTNSGNFPFVLGRPYHLATAMHNGRLVLTIDGKYVSSVTPPTPQTAVGGAGELWIGRWPGHDFTFHGILDDVLLMKRGLSLDEMYMHYRAARILRGN